MLWLMLTFLEHLEHCYSNQEKSVGPKRTQENSLPCVNYTVHNCQLPGSVIGHIFLTMPQA